MFHQNARHLAIVERKGLAMISIARAVVTSGLAVFAALFLPANANAFCLTSAECPAGLICRAGFLGIPVCREIACNFDRDCPANQRPCAGGACQFRPQPVAEAVVAQEFVNQVKGRHAAGCNSAAAL